MFLNKMLLCSSILSISTTMATDLAVTDSTVAVAAPVLTPLVSTLDSEIPSETTIRFCGKTIDEIMAALRENTESITEINASHWDLRDDTGIVNVTRIAKALRALPNLKIVNLYQARINDAQAMEIFKKLAGSDTLEHVSIRYATSLTSKLVSVLKTLIETCPSLCVIKTRGSGLSDRLAGVQESAEYQLWNTAATMRSGYVCGYFLGGTHPKGDSWKDSFNTGLLFFKKDDSVDPTQYETRETFLKTYEAELQKADGLE